MFDGDDTCPPVVVVQLFYEVGYVLGAVRLVGGKSVFIGFGAFWGPLLFMGAEGVECVLDILLGLVFSDDPGGRLEKTRIFSLGGFGVEVLRELGG